MKVISHSADGFRNLKNTDIQAHPSMNIIFGENGQGKTNLLESIFLRLAILKTTLCCSGASFNFAIFLRPSGHVLLSLIFYYEDTLCSIIVGIIIHAFPVNSTHVVKVWISAIAV